MRVAQSHDGVSGPFVLSALLSRCVFTRRTSRSVRSRLQCAIDRRRRSVAALAFDWGYDARREGTGSTPDNSNRLPVPYLRDGPPILLSCSTHGLCSLLIVADVSPEPTRGEEHTHGSDEHGHPEPRSRVSCVSVITTVPVESRGGAYPVGIGGSSGAFATGPQSDSREHVSSPRSPNPAGRSPAPGSPVESCDSHTGSRARPADGSRERWHHARTLALAGRCVVRPVDALATATMQVVPFACACDDSPEFLLISGVIGRRPLP